MIYKFFQIFLRVRLMRVSIWPIRRTGMFRYLVRSWSETTPRFIAILINIRKNETN